MHIVHSFGFVKILVLMQLQQMAFKMHKFNLKKF